MRAKPSSHAETTAFGLEGAVASANNLTEHAYQYLKRLIITCAIPPGASFSEAQIAAEIGIGKSPVRGAISRLIQEGLVQSRPRHGHLCAPITLGDVQELFGFRLIVEPAAVQLAAGRVEPERIRRLDEICQMGYTLDDRASATAFLRANHEFHSIIARASGNRRLADAVERVLDESERLFHLGLMLRNRADEMAHEHRALVDALVAGDGETARRVATEQIVAAQRMVVDALVCSPSVQSVHVSLNPSDHAPVAADRPRTSRGRRP